MELSELEHVLSGIGKLDVRRMARVLPRFDETSARLRLKNALRARLGKLASGDGVTPQERGYRLEELVLALCALENLDPAPPSRPRGEQIDGLFELRQRTFLLEAKWHDKPMAGSDIFAFRGKMEGKLAGILGVFISHSGFSDDAPGTLVAGKTLNVLLVDGDDFKSTLSDAFSFAQLIQIKMRRAAQYGQIYYTVKQYEDEHNG